MIRTLFALALGLALSGCWLSEKDLFGDGDWAHLDLDGSYTSEDGNGQERGTVALTVRPSGLVEGVVTDKEGKETERSTVGFVQVTGGSGDFYIMVDRSDRPSGAGAMPGDLYMLGHRTSDGGLDVYWPQCSGTPDIEGMTRESPDLGLPGLTPDAAEATFACTFTTKKALLQAGLEAERFLSQPHIVEVTPMGRLQPKDNDTAD